MTKLNKGAMKVVAALKKKKEGYKSPKRDIKSGDKFNLVVDKVFRIHNGDKRFSGTARRIVLDMRFWDTGMGRVTNNIEYMKLVSERIWDFPVCTDEITFLKELERVGLVTIELPN